MRFQKYPDTCGRGLNQCMYSFKIRDLEKPGWKGSSYKFECSTFQAVDSHSRKALICGF